MYDYYPFGMLVPNRNYSSPEYRYGFQGQEKDDEIKGNGNSINYKFRMYDPRIGRFFAVDPLTPNYPFYSPYQFSANNPIGMLEIEGLEGIKHSEYDSSGKLIRHVVTLNIAVITVDKLDKSIKENLFNMHGKKVGRKKWKKIKRERVSSSYSTNSVQKIKSILESGYKNKKNSAGEKVDFVFNVSEIHLDSDDLTTMSKLVSQAKFDLATESGELRDIPFVGKDKTYKYKMSPLNLIKSGNNPSSARGWNNNLITIISDGDGLDETTILHETAHQLLLRNKGEAEHNLISPFDFRLGPSAVDAILEDAYERKKEDIDKQKGNAND